MSHRFTFFTFTIPLYVTKSAADDVRYYPKLPHYKLIKIYSYKINCRNTRTLSSSIGFSCVSWDSVNHFIHFTFTFFWFIHSLVAFFNSFFIVEKDLKMQIKTDDVPTDRNDIRKKNWRYNRKKRDTDLIHEPKYQNVDILAFTYQSKCFVQFAD